MQISNSELNQTNFTQSNKLSPEIVAEEVLETLNDDELKDLALIYLTDKYSKLAPEELKNFYIKFNGIESIEEFNERLGQY